MKRAKWLQDANPEVQSRKRKFPSQVGAGRSQDAEKEDAQRRARTCSSRRTSQLGGSKPVASILSSARVE